MRNGVAGIIKSRKEPKMATDFAGTHSERIDKLTGSHVELRTMVRVSAAAIVLLFQ